MMSLRNVLLVGVVAFFGVLSFAVAAQQSTESDPRGNAYYFFTKRLHVDDSGRVAIPPRFQWSVETSFSGVDAEGTTLPDSRVMLRLYDPDQNSTALTAQMDLATAARLHHELGEIIVNMLKDPGFEHRPQLYDPKLIPLGQFKGIDDTGTAIIEFEYRESGQAK